ncbi:MAG: hypothetical protein AAF236_11725 [Verrucomicrobiota bacterium]
MSDLDKAIETQLADGSLVASARIEHLDPDVAAHPADLFSICIGIINRVDSLRDPVERPDKSRVDTPAITEVDYESSPPGLKAILEKVARTPPAFSWLAVPSTRTQATGPMQPTKMELAFVISIS